jgi:hypothetical protein
MRAKRVHYLFIHYREQVLQNGLDFRENLHIVVSHHAQASCTLQQDLASCRVNAVCKCAYYVLCFIELHRLPFPIAS